MLVPCPPGDDADPLRRSPILLGDSMNNKPQIDEETLAWLLAPDPLNPGIRYFALRDLVGLPAESAELQQARQAVMSSGPVPLILAEQHPEGFWV